MISAICAGIASISIAAGILCLVVEWRGLVAELDRDQRSGYQLPTEAKPKQRQCPPWLNRKGARRG